MKVSPANPSVWLFRSFNEVFSFDKNHGLRRQSRAGSGAYHEIFLMQGAFPIADGTSGFG